MSQEERRLTSRSSDPAESARLCRKSKCASADQLISQRLDITGVAILRTSPGSAAAAAGLRGLRAERDGAILPGDIIVAVNGHAIDSVARLQSRLDDYNVGEIVRLTVLRDKQRVEVPVRLQASAQ